MARPSAVHPVLPDIITESFAVAVQLGGFFSVTLLIVVLMAARLGIRLLVDGQRTRDGSA